jgi:hypothetical protein
VVWGLSISYIPSAGSACTPLIANSPLGGFASLAYYTTGSLPCVRSYTAQAFILSLSVYFFLYLNAYCLIRVAADIKELAYFIFTPQLFSF